MHAYIYILNLNTHVIEQLMSYTKLQPKAAKSPAKLKEKDEEGGIQFTTHYTCFTSTKVQILTPEAS